MLSKDVEIAIRVALNDAHRRHHELATVEHLTYALLHDDETANVLRHCGADVKKLKEDFEKFLEEQVEVIEGDDFETTPSRGFQRVAAADSNPRPNDPSPTLNPPNPSHRV